MAEASSPPEEPEVAPVHRISEDVITRSLRAILPRWARRGFPGFLVLCILVLYVPVAALHVFDNYRGLVTKASFFGDYAAVSYILAVPVLLIGRRVFYSEWHHVSRIIVSSGLLQPQERAKLFQSQRSVKRLLASWKTLAGVIVLAYLLSLLIYVETLLRGDGGWIFVLEGDVRVPALAGLYLYTVSVPVFISLVFFWAVIFSCWAYFLKQLAALRPKIVGYHPDRAGGLGFLSDACLGHTILIFSIGLVIMAVIMYKINVEGVSPYSVNIIVMLVLYLVLAPTLFFAPLLVFTKQLYKARKAALKKLNSRGYVFATQLSQRSSEDHSNFDRHVQMAHMQMAYENVYAMRIWPVDFRTISRFAFSTLTPLLPLVLRILG